MAKEVLPFSRNTSGWAIPPECLVLIGLDTNHGPEHPQYDPRVFNEVTPTKVAQLRMAGSRVPALQVYVQELTPEFLKTCKKAFLDKAKATWKRLNPERDFPDRLPVVATGRQRTLAGRELSKLTLEENGIQFFLPATHFRPDTDDKEFGLRILENTARTNMTPLEKAEEIERYMKKFGASEDIVATSFNIPKQYVQKLLGALDLVDDVKDAIRSNKISFNQTQKPDPWGGYDGAEQRRRLKLALDPTAGASGEDDGDADGEGGEGGEGGGEGGGKLPAGASTPKGHAVPRATMEKIYRLKVEENLLEKFDVRYAHALGWACGILKGDAIPPPIVDALRKIAEMEAAKEQEKAKRAQEKAAKAQEKAKKAEGKAAAPTAATGSAASNTPPLNLREIANSTIDKDKPVVANEVDF